MSKKKNTHHVSNREKLVEQRTKVRRRRLNFLVAGGITLTLYLMADYFYDIPLEWYALTLWIFPLAWFFDTQYLKKINDELQHH